MSKAPTSFIEVIGLWPSRFEMASDIDANPEAIRKWGERNSIPSEWWAVILATATAQRAGLTAEILVELSARPAAQAESAEARP